MTSIVMLSLNHLIYTRQCLESLWRETSTPYELIVVDNGSEEETVDFLRRLWCQGPYARDINLILNPENLGIARAWNQGIKAARGREICIINNDLVLTRDWLGKLLGYLEEHPEAGIVSPHVFDGEPPADLAACAAAHEASRGHEEEDGFHGCCFLLTRPLLEAVGLFDEQFEVATWEDVDYRHRARLAGFEARVTHRSVIYHYGSKTIQDLSQQRGGNDFYLQNADRFARKWGITLGHFTVSRSTLYLIKDGEMKPFEGLPAG